MSGINTLFYSPTFNCKQLKTEPIVTFVSLHPFSFIIASKQFELKFLIYDSEIQSEISNKKMMNFQS